MSWFEAVVANPPSGLMSDLSLPPGFCETSEEKLFLGQLQLNPDGSVDQSDSSPSPPLPAPSCLVPGEQCPEQASLALLTCSDAPGQSKKKRGFFFKGKNLFKKLGSNKKN
ncbi:hypothetical protein IHE44_0007613 [Lamprotornis superbus]|uniref:Uncharacterized protein n=1 Tax=Lamprotornis superbus TaxID=245042 RepID=A0A835NQ48_9PASS|nr:hypothetical protein IHE44_0007613 [Lamprotornis superbus]